MATNEKERDEVTFEVVEHLGVVASYPTGWKKELNKVAWNGNAAKFDIRDWDESHEHMSRGITLHTEEAKKVFELLKGVVF